MLVKYFEKPPRFEYLHKWLEKPAVKILDVGCANHSPSRTKKHYPKCRYYGLDKTEHYSSGDKNSRCMEMFFRVDLSNTEDIEKVPDGFFDCLILAHVIEHLENAEEVILKLSDKLNKNGVIYIEFPSPRSLRLPNMKGTLNFHDDPTHVKLYQPEQIENLLRKNDFVIKRSGTRRSIKRIFLLPLYAVVSLLYHGYIGGSVFWDITGFAYYIIASKE